jgi:hypothetical protein
MHGLNNGMGEHRICSVGLPHAILLPQGAHGPKPRDDGILPWFCRFVANDVRALALKALDQRLHAANLNKSTTPAPAVAPMVASINTSGGDEGPTAQPEMKVESS